MNKKRLAIIGTGAIGTSIAEELKNHLHEHYQLVGMMKQSENDLTELSAKLNTKITTNFSDLLELNPDYIIEAASVDVVTEYGEAILSRGIHFIPLSIGALADTSFYEQLEDTAKRNHAILYIPSGAIGGFDLMRKMTLADEPTVEFNTYKSPDSLGNAPFLQDEILPKDKKKVVFKGSAKEAIEAFPANINVAVATALATIGPENVRTTIHSDPEQEYNTHLITMSNSEGAATIRVEAKPSGNVSTSSITSWSVISLLKNIADSVRFF